MLFDGEWYTDKLRLLNGVLNWGVERGGDCMVRSSGPVLGVEVRDFTLRSGED